MSPRMRVRSRIMETGRRQPRERILWLGFVVNASDMSVELEDGKPREALKSRSGFLEM